ncbi:MAG: class I SAM-dependent methyltransferase, partial [Patescibacteria group bacterium]
MDKDWEKIYDELDMVQRDIVPVVREFPDYLLQQGKQAYVVLDHGCGMGKNAFFLTEAMSRHGVDVTVDALDASQGALSIFQKVIEKSGLLKERPRAWINPRLHKIGHLFPFDDRRFDGVLSVMALQHGLTSQIQEWSNDIGRVLSDGGLLCLAVPSTEDPRYATGEE